MSGKKHTRIGKPKVDQDEEPQEEEKEEEDEDEKEEESKDDGKKDDDSDEVKVVGVKEGETQDNLTLVNDIPQFSITIILAGEDDIHRALTGKNPPIRAQASAEASLDMFRDYIVKKAKANRIEVADDYPTRGSLYQFGLAFGRMTQAQYEAFTIEMAFANWDSRGVQVGIFLVGGPLGTLRALVELGPWSIPSPAARPGGG